MPAQDHDVVFNIVPDLEYGGIGQEGFQDVQCLLEWNLFRLFLRGNGGVVR